MNTNHALYDEYIASREFERVDLVELLVERFGVKCALYPGSFVHVSPSFVIPSVTYVDTDRRCPGFFADPATLRLVNKRKRYEDEPEVTFHHGDYLQPFGEDDESFDLLISQWAGPVSQACKRYLKIGGLLVANNSHGDASLASLDNDYQLVAIANQKASRYSLSETNLEGYFVPKAGRVVHREDIVRTGSGIPYTKSPAAYVFRRVR